MTFIDTNIIIDILDKDPVWFEWSATRLSSSATEHRATINAIVVAELSRGFAAFVDLQSRLQQLALDPAPIDEETAFLAGKRFVEFRRSRETRATMHVLPDFFIAAHAVTLEEPLLTRDPALYRRYFPDLPLITPETDHG